MPFTRTDTGGLARLRRATAPLHEAVEARGDLPGSLQTRADVAGLLRRWLLLVHRLRPLTGSWLADDPAGSIVADLHRLGHDVGTADVDLTIGTTGTRPTDVDLTVGTTVDLAVDLPRPASTPGQLGTAWVLLGARIGLRTMAPHVRQVTGHDLTTLAGPDVGALTGVRHQLDRLDYDDLAAATDAASTAFRIAATTIGGPPWQE